MIWIAIVIGVFLFYKFVERPHKILVAKIAGVLSAVATIGLGGLFIYERVGNSTQDDGGDVDVYFSSHAPNFDIARIDALREAAYRATISGSMLADLDTESALISKFDFLSAGSLSDSLRAEIFPGPSLDLDTYFKTMDLDVKDPEVAKANAAALEYDLKRVGHFLKDIPRLKEQFKTRVGFLLALHLRLEALDKGAQDTFLKGLEPPDRYGLSSIQGLKTAFEENYRRSVNAVEPETLLSLLICNRKDKPLNKVSFYVYGLESGRSSRLGLNGNEFGTDLKSDIIVGPMSCLNVQWTARYRLFDRYEFGLVSGEWDYK